MSKDIQTGDTVQTRWDADNDWRTFVVTKVSEDRSQVRIARGMSEFWIPVEQVRETVPCDECYVQPDGTHDDGTMCPCAAGLTADTKTCRCQPSPAEWLGPAYIRAEMAAAEGDD